MYPKSSETWCEIICLQLGEEAGPAPVTLTFLKSSWNPVDPAKTGFRLCSRSSPSPDQTPSHFQGCSRICLPNGAPSQRHGLGVTEGVDKDWTCTWTLYPSPGGPAAGVGGKGRQTPGPGKILPNRIAARSSGKPENSKSQT